MGTAAAASLLTTNSYEGNGETQDGEAYSIESHTQATVVQPDGKILLAGYAEPSAGDENASLGANPSSSTSWGWIAQFNQDDSPDTTFGSSQTGVVPVDFTASPANPTGITATQSGIMAMALNPVNGDVVVVGYCYTDSSEVEQDGFGDQLPSLGVAEYLTSPTVINNQIFAVGQPDPNFNGGYPVLFSSADTASVGTQVTVLTSSGVAGDILIGGTEATVGITSGSQPAYAVPDFMLMRLLPNGQLDTTFNGTGVAQQPDVTLLPAYAPFSASSPNLDLVNYLSEASGLSADTTFITTVEGWQAAVHSLSILSNGNILLAGDAGRASNYEDYPAWIPDVGMTLVEYDPNGTLADGFGTAGVSFISSGQFDSYDGEPEPIGQAVAISVEQTADNGFLIAGFAGPSVTDDTAAHVVFAEINANGDLDTSYFGSGIYNDDSLLYQSSDSVMYDTSEFFGYGGGWGIGSYNRWNGVFGNLVSSFQLNSEMTMADGSLFYSSSFYSTQTQYQSTNGFEWDIDEVNPETGLLVPGFGNDGVLEVPAQEMNAGVGGSTFDADVQHSTLVVDGDELLMGGMSGQPYFDPIQGAPLNPAWNISDPHPLIISYQTNVQASVSNPVPLATAKGTVQLTWTNTGSGEDGFEILRATNPSDLTVRHEVAQDQRMRDPPEELTVHLGSHRSIAVGQPAVVKPPGQVRRKDG